MVQIGLNVSVKVNQGKVILVTGTLLLHALSMTTPWKCGESAAEIFNFLGGESSWWEFQRWDGPGSCIIWNKLYSLFGLVKVCQRDTFWIFNAPNNSHLGFFVDLYFYWNHVVAWNFFLPSLSVKPASLILRISEAASDQASTWGKVGWFKEWKPANELWWNKILFQPRRSSIEWWFQWGRSYSITLRRWWSTFVLIVSAVCNLVYHDHIISSILTVALPTHTASRWCSTRSTGTTRLYRTPPGPPSPTLFPGSISPASR